MNYSFLKKIQILICFFFFMRHNPHNQIKAEFRLYIQEVQDNIREKNQGFTMYNERPAAWRQLVIIETSPRWRSKNEYDMPMLGTITEIVKRVQYPEAFIRNFNHCAMSDISLLWAGFTSEHPEIGKVVAILPFNAEAQQD